VSGDFNDPDFNEIDTSTGFATRGFSAGDGIFRLSSKQFLAIAFDGAEWRFKDEATMMVDETWRVPFWARV